MSESPAADDNTGTNSIWIKAPVVAQRLGILEVTRLPLGRKTQRHTFRMLLSSRIGGGCRNEQTRHEKILPDETAERSSHFGLGSQQSGGTRQLTFTGIEAGLSTCNRRIHPMVLI